MKKAILQACFLFLNILVVAKLNPQSVSFDYEQPVSDDKTIIDTFAFNPVPNGKVIIKCPVNATGMTFEILAHDPETKQWRSLGTVTGNKKLSVKKMSAFRYFAIRNEDSCSYEFSTKNYNLVITVKYSGPLIIDGIIMDETNSLILKIIDNDADDFFKFESYSNQPNILFQAYVMKKRNLTKWESFGAKTLHGYGDIVTIETNDPCSYGTLVMYFKDGCNFTAAFEEKHSDLYVKLFDSPKVVKATSSATPSKIQDLILDGKTYSAEEIENMGGITSWYCTSSSGNKVLVEVGYFNTIEHLGFILYDGTNEGISGCRHFREGLDHRWDWGEKEDGHYAYSFIVKPDGTGLYYHFLEGENTAKPSSLYKAYKR